MTEQIHDGRRVIYSRPDEMGDACVEIDHSVTGDLADQLWLRLCGTPHFDVVIESDESAALGVMALGEEIDEVIRQLAEGKRKLIRYAIEQGWA